jgi:hypothetical protein
LISDRFIILRVIYAFLKLSGTVCDIQDIFIPGHLLGSSFLLEPPYEPYIPTTVEFRIVRRFNSRFNLEFIEWCCCGFGLSGRDKFRLDKSIEYI